MKNKIYALIILFILPASIFSQGRIMLESSAQYLKNNSSGENFIYFYEGIQYRTNNYYVSLNVPIVLSNNTIEENSSGNNSYGMMGGDESASHLLSNSELGLGDVYLNGSINIFRERNYSPLIAVEGYLKFPTASNYLNISSGELDYLVGLSLSKTVERFYFYVRGAYLNLGSNSNTGELKSPFYYSVSAGYFLPEMSSSIMISYDKITEIVTGINSPEQISIGIGKIMNKDLTVSLITNLGLNNASDYYTVSMGFQYSLSKL